MKDFRALDKNLKLRLVIIFLGTFSYGTVFSSMTIYYNQYFGAGLTGALLILSSVVTFLAGLLAGHFSDKYGRKPTMLWGSEFFVVGSLVALASNSPLATNPWTTYVGFLLISTGFNLLVTAGNAMIIDVTDTTNRKTVFALDYWAQNLAVIIGAAIGAWLFKPAFFALLIMLFVETIAVLLITALLITETRPEASDALEKSEPEGEPSTGEAAPEGIFRVYLTVAKDRTYMIFMAANTLSLFLIMQFDNFLPVHLADSFQTLTIAGFEIYGQRMLTVYLILACLLVVLFMQPLNHATALWPHRRGFIIGVVFMTIGMSLSFLSTTFWPILISCGIYTFGEILYTPSVQTIGADLMPTDKVGAYNGASSIRQPLASILAAAVVTASPVIKPLGAVLSLLVACLLAILLLIRAVNRWNDGKAEAEPTTGEES